MILRRLSESLKQQNWTAIWIEFVLLVAGVFLGIQVSNWNEERRDQALAHEYLERLRDDFTRSIKRAERNIESMKLQFVLEGEMIGRLRACHLDDDQRAGFAMGIYLVGRLEAPTLVRGTIDELQSTGRMGIIRNLKVRQILSDIVKEDESDTQILGWIMARATPQITYIDSSVVLLQEQDGFGADGPLSDQVVFDFPRLCRDPAYVGAVSTLQELTNVVIGRNKRAIAADRAILETLDAELGHKPESAK